eukprot:COSAG01_NODE_42511_length_439_cov_0.908824_1_plen_52_part_10
MHGLMQTGGGGGVAQELEAGQHLPAPASAINRRRLIHPAAPLPLATAAAAWL